MIRLFAAIAMAGSVMAISAGAGTDFMTGTQILKHCQSADPRSQGICLGYVEGAADQIIKPSAPEICLPAGVGAEQIRDVVVRFIQGESATQLLAARPQLLAALIDAFPCHKQ